MLFIITISFPFALFLVNELVNNQSNDNDNGNNDDNSNNYFNSVTIRTRLFWFLNSVIVSHGVFRGGGGCGGKFSCRVTPRVFFHWRTIHGKCVTGVCWKTQKNMYTYIVMMCVCFFKSTIFLIFLYSSCNWWFSGKSFHVFFFYLRKKT